MKKIPVCLILVALMSSLLFGCSNNDQSANATSTSSSEVTVQPSAEEEPDESSTPESEGEDESVNNQSESFNPDNSIDDPIDPDDSLTSENTADPLAPLMVTESFAKSYGGIYLVRNGNLYALTENIPRETSVLYNVGWRRNQTYGILYKLVEDETIEGTNYVTMGDVPLVTLQEGDEIRGYQYPGLALESANDSGYSLRMVEGAYESTRLLIFEDLDSVDPIILSESLLKNLEIKDEDGNSVALEDIHNLEYQKHYFVSWYENGTEYREVEMIANCHYYTCRRKGQMEPYEYDIDGELTKNGYAIIDLSGVEPGLYRIEVGYDGFIKIP